MARTVDDYDSMAKREMIKAKQEKAMMYVHARSLARRNSDHYFLCLALGLSDVYVYARDVSGAFKSSGPTMLIYAVSSRKLKLKYARTDTSLLFTVLLIPIR